MTKLKTAFKSLGTAAVLAATTLNAEGADNQPTEAFSFQAATKTVQKTPQANQSAPVFTQISPPMYNNLPKPMVTSRDFINVKPDKIENDGILETRTFFHKNGSKTEFCMDKKSMSILHYNGKDELTHEVSYRLDNSKECSLTIYKNGNLAASFVGGMPKTDIFATPTPIKMAFYLDKSGNGVKSLFDSKGNRTEINVSHPNGTTTVYNFGNDGKVCTETLLDANNNPIRTIGNKNAFKTNDPALTPIKMYMPAQGNTH